VFERYSESARRALFYARLEAEITQSETIESTHVLLGVLCENEQSVATLLSTVNIDPHAFRKSLTAEEVPLPRIPQRAELPIADDAKRILYLAALEADQLNSYAVTGCHLILGMLRVDSSQAAQLLAKGGLTPQMVRDFLAREST
jgi:ATP-dependent Clp protease ATP-binding subunit ClpA